MKGIAIISKGNILSNGSFISGTKYNFIDSITYIEDGVERTIGIGDHVTTYDHDTFEYIDGIVDHIFDIDDPNECIEISFESNDPYGRIDLSNIEWV